MHIKKRVFVLLAVLVALVVIPAVIGQARCDYPYFPYWEGHAGDECNFFAASCTNNDPHCTVLENGCNGKNPTGYALRVQYSAASTRTTCADIPFNRFGPGSARGEKLVGTYVSLAPTPPLPGPTTGVTGVSNSVQYQGKTYGVALSTDPARDTGDEACARVGMTCVGANVRSDAICKIIHPTAATTSSSSGDLSGVYCDGAPQTNVCSTRQHTCHTCPACSISVPCNQVISNLYREMYFECAPLLAPAPPPPTPLAPAPPPPPPTPPTLPTVLVTTLSTAGGTVLTGENVVVNLDVTNPSSSTVSADVHLEVCDTELSVTAGNPSLSLVAASRFQTVDDLLSHWTTSGGFSLRGQVDPNLIQQMNNYMGNGAYELVIKGYTPPGGGKLTFATCGYSWGSPSNEVCMNMNYWRPSQNRPYVRQTFFFDSKQQFWDAYNAHDSIFAAGLDFNQGRLECQRYVPIPGSRIGGIQWVTTCPSGTTCVGLYCEPNNPPTTPSPFYTTPPPAPATLPLSSSITTMGISSGALYTPMTAPQLHYCAGNVERLTWSVSIPAGDTQSFFTTYGTLVGYPVDVVAGFTAPTPVVGAMTRIDLKQPLRVGPFGPAVSAQLGIVPGARYPIYNLSDLLFVLNVTDINFTLPNVTVPFAFPANVFLPGFNGSATRNGTTLTLSKNPHASPATNVACSRATVNHFLRLTGFGNILAAFTQQCTVTAATPSGVGTGTGSGAAGNTGRAINRITGGGGGGGGRSSVVGGSSVGQIIQGAAQTLQASADLAKVGVDTAVDAARNVAALFRPIDPRAVTSATCEDGILNQGEVRVDCGGPCKKCATTEGPALIPSGVWVAGFIGLLLLLSILVVTLMIQQRGRSTPEGRQGSLSGSFRPQSASKPSSPKNQ